MKGGKLLVRHVGIEKIEEGGTTGFGIFQKLSNS